MKTSAEKVILPCCPKKSSTLIQSCFDEMGGLSNDIMHYLDIPEHTDPQERQTSTGGQF